MAGEQLEKTLDVDLSALDAKLKQEEVLWRSIDERSEQLEKKLIKQKLLIERMERGFVASSGAVERSAFDRAIIRAGKRSLGNVISSGLSMTGIVAGGIGGRLGNVASDAIFGAQNIAQGGIFGAIMWGITEITQRIAEQRERMNKIDDLIHQYYEDVRMNELREKYKREDDEFREEQERLDAEAKSRIELNEMLYQASQYLDE